MRQRRTAMTAMVMLIACAWVLWGRSYTTAPMLAASGHETLQACQAELAKKEQGKGIHWACLPDTVDPRPKEPTPER
jgi:hypothetical protein